MSVIKPRTRGKRLVKHNTRLDEQNQETLYAYAQFIGESTEYVIHQLLDTGLAKDEEFVQWRADHPQSCAPRPVTRPLRRAHRVEPIAKPALESTAALSVS